MIEESAVYGTSAAVYAVALVVLLAWLRRVPTERRALCYPVVLVVGVGTVSTTLLAAGLGTVTIGGTAVTVPSFLDDLLAYSVLWAVTARLVDVDGRALGVIVVTPIVQRIAFEIAAITGGAVALAGVLVVVGGHVALGGYLLGPIWRRTRDVPEQRRLLHWKARNLLLFLIGMLIVFAVVTLVGLFDTFVSLVIQQYMTTLIRVGFAGFLFANLDAVGTASLLPSTRGDGTASGTAAD